jgi:hypothetical protein
MAVFDFFARRNVEPGKERSLPVIISIDNKGEEKIQLTLPRLYSPIVTNELGKRLLYMLKLAEDNFSIPSNSQRPANLVFDNNTKYRWNEVEKLDLSPETELTEHDFWLAYIRKYTENILKNKDNRNELAMNDLDKKIVLIEQRINTRSSIADFITEIHDKLENINASQQKFVENSLDLINKSPALIDYETKVTLGGKDYRVTPKMKKVLTELSRRSGWVTAKELSLPAGESEAYICDLLAHLMRRGYPITSYKSSGKRFWALEKEKDEVNGKTNNMQIVEKQSLLLHALHIFCYLKNRPPTTSEIASELKWDALYVKNELNRMKEKGLVKDEKRIIDGKKLKVWLPGERC